MLIRGSEIPRACLGDRGRFGSRDAADLADCRSDNDACGGQDLIVGTLAGKDWVASCIGRTQPGPGFMYVPADRHAGWFEQMTNEKRVSFMSNGRRATRWRPMRLRGSCERCQALAQSRPVFLLPRCQTCPASDVSACCH
ncbi:terminase gpA endonuclease subunit [Paenirhodobacter populi]|uniref:terminase gpA endonuclease subunit n=1 Tax=Paenirhodobacter populi TaxID=2306993 RepID=UPI0013E30205